MSLPDLQEPLRLLEEKNVDTAVEVLERKVSALPAHLGAHVLLAYAYEAQERWTQALESWEEVHFLMPNSPIAEDGKRRVLRRMEGITAGDERAFAREQPEPESHATEPEVSSPDTADEEPETASSPDTENSSDEASSPDTETSSEEADAASDEAPEGLAQLRRQAEREARQGGARPGLSETPPSIGEASDDDPSSEASSPPDEPPSTTPEEQIEHLEDEGAADELDQLIDKLQSARIDPDPDAETDAPPPDAEPFDDEDESEEVVSETLARIHEGQDDYEKAAHIYAQLAEQEPDRADEFREKAAELRERAKASDEDA
ncbi:MAG: hypothetical protein ABEK84_10385 [Salinibacter sp.]